MASPIAPEARASFRAVMLNEVKHLALDKTALGGKRGALILKGAGK
jgi:hypothetical protein